MASIRERTSKAGQRSWAVLYRVHGKQSSMTFATAKSARKFHSLVEAVGAAQALDMLNKPEVDGVTVAELAEMFLTKKARDVTSRTLTDYRRDYANWIEPWFGPRPATSLDERDVQAWVDHMAGRLAPKSVGDRHMLLYSMFKFGRAKSRGLVDHNPCEETELPKRGAKGAPKGLTLAEVDVLLEATGRRNPDAHDLILFLAETGWRWSEAAALDVRDVEDDGERVWVTVTRVFRIDGQYRQVLVEGAAKSGAAFRRIRLLPRSAAVVRRRLIGRGPGDLVFSNTRGNHWNQNTWLRETWPRIVAAAGLTERKPTPHWLRHTHVAALAAAGVSLPQIQRRVGHEHVETTVGVYGRMIEDIGDDAYDSLAKMMTAAAPAPAGHVVSGSLVELLES